MSDTDTFQISVSQAELYEACFVPAIFGQWPGPLLDAAGVHGEQRVLDVACGTGVLARAAADRIDPDGHVAGVDINPGMLAVAARLRPDLHWHRGDVAVLPFEDASFDAVLCQSALMFFADPTRALGEMARVCVPDGTVGVQVYRGLQDQPAYGPWTDLVARHAGPEARRLLGTYWIHGDVATLRSRFTAAGIEVTSADVRPGLARWTSIKEMVEIEIDGTPLGERIDAATRRDILDESHELFARYTTPTGVDIPLDAIIVVARR